MTVLLQLAQSLTRYSSLTVGCFSVSLQHVFTGMLGLDIIANRLFGPQPRTATYVCIWEIALGSVKASMSANDVTLLTAAANAFRSNFVDVVNAPADEFMPAVDPDGE